MKYLIALLAVLALTSCGSDATEEEFSDVYSNQSEEDISQDEYNLVDAFPVTFPDGTVINCAVYPGIAMECFE